MSAPEYITAQIRSYISQSILPVLPAEIQLVSIEVVSWLITVHLYQHEVFSERSRQVIEEQIERLVGSLTPRAGEAWQCVPAYHRSDTGVRLVPAGLTVYAA